MNQPPSGQVPLALPRTSVLASAGTGKTYALSSRLIGLLALGAEPDTILASTFTRKAAGEILGRVLSRLANASLDPGDAEVLSRDISLVGAPPVRLQQAGFAGLLRRLVRNLHRVNIGTLDALLIRMAGAFSGDLGIPPDWVIGDEPTARRIESESLQRVLGRAEPAETAELVRMTMRGESGRGVHQRLLGQLLEARALVLHRELPQPDELWALPEPARFSDSVGAESGTAWSDLFELLRGATVPVSASGKPDGRFQKAIETGIESLARGDWEKFCSAGLGAKILEDELEFYGKPIPTEVVQAYNHILTHVAQEVLSDLRAQSRALRALVTGFDDELNQQKRQEGSYRFSDITLLLADADPMAGRQDLWYRLDQKAHHLLLDEFQDTSRAQWEALHPLATEILSGHEDERSALLVADPKQSIYGWRGAEPGLAARIETRYALTRDHLDRSYRSSGTVLDLVNQVFGGLSENPIWDLRADSAEAAGRWAKGFKTHSAAKDLQGYVRMVAGPPKPPSGRSDRPEFMAWAAEVIGEIHAATPGATLGVLVRRNAAVSRIIGSLRKLGIDVSEEGSGTVADSPAVAACLALLRLADHPGDRISAYLVGKSPLGGIIGFQDPEDVVRCRYLALEVRRDLLENGYPATLESWINELTTRGHTGPREEGRLHQLLELAYRWEGRKSLRPTDFVRWVESESVEAPTEARLRVMTVHQAKGLEFDVVVLPELHLSLASGQGLHQAVLPLLNPDTGRLERIFPSLPSALRPLFPQVQEAGRQDREAELHDALGVAYVAMTRARHALHLLVESDPPEKDPKPAFTFAGLVTGGLGLDGVRIHEGDVLFEAGNPGWAGTTEAFIRAPVRSDASETRSSGTPLLPRPSRPRGRFRPQKSPSSLGHGEAETLGALLGITGTEGLRQGSIAHVWLEGLTWLEDWHPDPVDLHEAGKGLFPGFSREESDNLLEDLQRWLAAPPVLDVLSRASHPEGTSVLTEVPFAISLEGVLYQGRIDRVVLSKDRDRVVAAEVLDFKTDFIEPGNPSSLAEAEARYRAQVEVYRRAVARRTGLPIQAIRGALIFLKPGLIRYVDEGPGEPD